MAKILMEIRMSNGDRYLAETPVDADGDPGAQGEKLFRLTLSNRFLVVRANGATEDDPTTMLFQSQIASVQVLKGDDDVQNPVPYELVMPPS